MLEREDVIKVEEVEDEARRKNKSAILLLISLERTLRKSIEMMLNKRYLEAGSLGCTLHELECAYKDAIKDCNLDKDHTIGGNNESIESCFCD